MARPTDDPKETKIMLRVNEETRGYIVESAKRQGTTVSGYIRNMIEREKNPQKGDFVTHISADIVDDFEVILELCDTDFNSFFKALYRKVESGEIDVDEIMK